MTKIDSISNEYKNALFAAIMWSQAVENLTRTCVMKCVANGKLSFKDEVIRKINDEYGLGRLARNSANCLPDDLRSRLLSFSKERNELAHRAADLYMTNLLAGMSREELDRELWKLEEITKSAGDLYGELLDLHT